MDESEASKTPVCPKCGSHHIMPNVRIVDHGDQGIHHPLSAEVDRNPTARMFKNPVASAMHAVVCGDCGFAEIYVDNPAVLYDAYGHASR